MRCLSGSDYLSFTNTAQHAIGNIIEYRVIKQDDILAHQGKLLP